MSRISKGKLHHLWSLYDVWDRLIFREIDRKVALRRKLRGIVPNPKFHLGIRDTAGHTLTVETYDNGVTASVVRNDKGKVLAYDFEADIHSDWIVKLDPKDLENYKGRVLRPDGLPDMDVAKTYPHVMETFDEENFDRIVAEMGAQLMLRMQIPIHEQIRLDIIDDPNALVELVDGVWRRKGQYPHEMLVEKSNGSLETFDPSKAKLWGMGSMDKLRHGDERPAVS